MKRASQLDLFETPTEAPLQNQITPEQFLEELRRSDEFKRAAQVVQALILKRLDGLRVGCILDRCKWVGIQPRTSWKVKAFILTHLPYRCYIDTTNEAGEPHQIELIAVLMGWPLKVRNLEENRIDDTLPAAG
jgi:hypothetical protein